MATDESRNVPSLLVAKPLLLQHCVMFLTLAQRAWYAWHCLARDKKGNPPSLRKLSEESTPEISHGQLHKLVMGKSSRPGITEFLKMAKALQCDPQWLQDGTGEAPTPQHHLQIPNGPPPRPKKEPKVKASTGRDELPTGDVATFKQNAEKISQRPLRGIPERTSK